MAIGSTSQTEALTTLARYRTIGARKSPEVVALGQKVLSGATSLGDQEWAVREQLAIAAMDLDLLPLASQQLLLLNKRFPKSPRVAILEAMLCEARGEYDDARRMYGKLMADSRDGAGEAFIPAHQRLITLSLYAPTTTRSLDAAGKGSSVPTSVVGSSSSATSVPPPPAPHLDNIIKTLPLLIQYLDTFHTDPDAWALLSDLYLHLSGWEIATAPSDTIAGWGLDEIWRHGGLLVAVGLEALPVSVAVKRGESTYLPQAMSAMSQRMLMEPWSWMALARYAELAILHGDFPLAYKTLLRAIEISTPPSTAAPAIHSVEISSPFTNVDLPSIGGWTTRLWWDLKIVCWALRRLEDGHLPANEIATDESIVVEHVSEVEDLVRERLEGMIGKDRVEGWDVWAGIRKL